MQSVTSNHRQEPTIAHLRHERSIDKLARQLIADYGVEGAKRICREYCGDGIGQAIDEAAANKS